MQDQKEDTNRFKIFGILFWLFCLGMGATLLLEMTAGRVGEHRSSTFGQAYGDFQQSWGGEIGIFPPEFKISYKVPAFYYTRDSLKRLSRDSSIVDIPLFPNELNLNAELDFHEQERGWLKFNAFTFKNSDSYKVINNSGRKGKLMVKFKSINGANLTSGLKVTRLPEREPIKDVNLDSWITLDDNYGEGDICEFSMDFESQGMDLYTYSLSSVRQNITQKLEASIRINTPEYELFRFGIPHEVLKEEDAQIVKVSLDNFTSSENLGINFIAGIQHLEQIESAIAYAPLAVFFFLLMIFLGSQTRNVKFHPFHYLLTIVVQLFFFIFLAYFVRFFGFWLSFGLSFGLSGIMALLYFPKVMGKRFFLKVVGPLFIWLTVIFSLAFLMPVFRGLSIALIFFVLFVLIMVEIGNTKIEKWDVLN